MEPQPTETKTANPKSLVPPTAPHTSAHRPGTSGSHASVDTSRSAQSHKEYLDSLHVPSADDISHISEVQLAREAEEKRKSRDIKRRSFEVSSPKPAATERPGHKSHGSRSSLFSRFGPGGEDSVRSKAATVIQRNYRGYRARREMKGLGIDATTRWTHALREFQYREMVRPRARSGVNRQASSIHHDGASEDDAVTSGDTAKKMWKRAAIIAKRAGLDQDSSDSDSDSGSESDSSTSSDSSSASAQRRAARKKKLESKAKRRNGAKTMGLQYFLEMVDLKHRYGSNLRVFHSIWLKSDTQESFFYWLDYGGGRFIDTDTCPRERLDREQVRYLSREERQYYLAKVDSEGRLCWTKNGARIDTTEKWKDSIHGIVPADDDTPAFRPVSEHDTRLLGDSSNNSDDDASESELEAARAAKYATPELDQAKGVKKVSHVSASTIFNKLLRKSVKKNTWIFVADTSFRLYVGIKNSGAFQHSSFLQGSRISAAGLIKIKNGRLTSLSPLSGHYRPPAANFRDFVKSLKEEGVDMSHVSISKAYAVLVGLEGYMQVRQRGKDIMAKMTHKKNKLVAPEETRKQEEAERDKSLSAEKERNMLEREERERDENRATVQLMQKLKISPREPAGQKGDGDSKWGPS